MRHRIRAALGRKAKTLTGTVAILLLVFASLAGCSQTSLAPLPLTTEQKVEDFRYLSQVFLDSNPYLWVSERKTGYDWPAHLDEFETEIAATKDDQEFALAMTRILGLLNNGHTGLLQKRAASLYGGFLVGLQMKQWKSEVLKTTGERIDYWIDLANWHPTSTGYAGSAFSAVYARGEYIVVGVNPQIAAGGVTIKPGWEVRAIGGVPAHEHVKQLLGKQPLWYDPIRDRLYQRWLRVPSVGVGGTNSGPVSVLFQTEEGGTVSTVSVDIPEEISGGGATYSWPPKYEVTSSRKTSSSNMFTILLDGNVAYVQIRSMIHNHKGDMALLRRFLTETNPKALIIDIRGNGGGSDNYWQALVSMLVAEPVRSPGGLVWRKSEYARPFIEQKGGARWPIVSRSHLETQATAGRVPPEILTPAFEEARAWDRTVNPSGDSIRFEGKICLLVDDYVFSSAESFAAFCKGSGWATVIGSFTGGDGIGFDPALVTLPNSGMLVRFPLVMGLNPDMSANEEQHTTPDVLAEWDPKDILAYASMPGGPERPDPAWDPQLRACLEWLAGE